MLFVISLQVRELVQLGCKDANWATKRILGYRFTYELAAQVSWLGRKGKHSSSALNTAKAVAGMTSLQWFIVVYNYFFNDIRDTLYWELIMVGILHYLQ